MTVTSCLPNAIRPIDRRNLETPSASPAALLWKNLSVFEPSRGCRISDELKEEKRILKGINGAIHYRSLNAIMGPSGAGKTTLLRCLFGTSSIKHTGSIFVGDKNTKAVFITQNEEDHLLLNLTVEEAIRFASRVKNNSSCSMVSKCMDSDLVSSIIDQLDLERCRYTLVGKCSGGQKKRLAIAQELASNIKPKIIFMDEPTSGIDSSVSYMVLKQLQALSQRNGIAILCTIHQPSYKTLELFDQLYILSRRGRVIYVGKPQLLRHHLLRYSLSCPDGHNPADVVIELASTETRRDHVALKPGCFGFCSTISLERDNMGMPPSSEIQKIETLEKVAEIECEELAERLSDPHMIEVRKLCSNTSPRTIFHTWFLFKRSFINSVWREKRWLLIRFLLHFLVAFILSFLYDGRIGAEDGCLSLVPQTPTTPPFVYSPTPSPTAPSPPQCPCPTPQDALKVLREENLLGKNVAFLFFNLMFLMFASLMPTALTFPAEMKVFLNEHRNGWYSTRSYFWAKNCVEFLVQLPLPYFYSLFIYWWTNQIGLTSVKDAIPFAQDSRFNRFVLITILSSFISQGVGLMIGAIFTHNYNISIFVSTVFMMFNFLFSGFFIKISQMGSVEFLTKFSFTRFAFEAMLVAIYGDRCVSPKESSIVEVVNETTTITSTDWKASSLSSSSSSSSFPSPPSSTMISKVLYQFDVDESLFQKSIMWMFVHLVGWRIFTYIVLWWKSNPDPTLRKVFFLYFALKKCSARKFLFTLLTFVIFASATLSLIILFV